MRSDNLKGQNLRIRHTARYPKRHPDMHLETYTIHRIRTKAIEFGIDFKLALFSRKRSLMSWIKTTEAAFPNLDWQPIELHYLLGDVKRAKKELKTIEKKLTRKDDTNAITPELIERARQYPVEQLVEFVQGKAYAFCHEDKNPSATMMKGGNKLRCWPCNKNFDPIDILTLRDKFSFAEAVRRLV